jgi:hypothetical protein
MSEVHLWLELASFASAPVVAVVAVVGLYQLWLAKDAVRAARDQLKVATEAIDVAREDIVTRSKREAAELAARQCEKFAETILPRVQGHMQRILNDGMLPEPWKFNGTDFRPGSLVDDGAANEWREKAMSGAGVVAVTSVAILNDCEALAIYFVSGAAEEKVAYPVIGAVFCNWVERFAPLLVAARDTKNAAFVTGHYQNVVELYKLWHGRTKMKRLEEEANRINLEATKVESELSQIILPDISPIGTGKVNRDRRNNSPM